MEQHAEGRDGLIVLRQAIAVSHEPASAPGARSDSGLRTRTRATREESKGRE